MWSRCILFALLLIPFVYSVNERQEKIVHISQGSVKGYKTSENLFAFYGIPYATAPTGKNRFKSPEPPPVWTETFEAIDEKTVCPQNTKIINITTKEIKENCLIANVYTPDTDERDLPVLVIIYGGALIKGYGEQITLKHLVSTKKMVAVTFNYRLGAHGFLCLGTENAPGNAGLKDQIALLRWVKTNIASFGGNPEDVTIVGYSAGAYCVDLLVLSPSAKDLFHKVSAESASNLGPTFVNNPVENAKSYAKGLGFDNIDDIYALEEFYLNASYETLVASDGGARIDSTIPLGPCVERQIPGNEPFLVEAPMNILKSGKFNKVPMLYGYSKMEGLVRRKNFDTLIQKMNENFAEFLPGNLQFENNEEKQRVAQDVKNFYFKEKKFEEDVLGYINFFSDVMYIHPILRSTRMYVESGHHEIYLYEFSYVSEFCPIIPKTNIRGAGHCEQTHAVLDGAGEDIKDESNFSIEYKEMKAMMRELWTNFITSGNPVPKGSKLPSWPATTADRSPHMSLTKPPILRGIPLKERAEFWDMIYEKHYSVPQPPSLTPTKKQLRRIDRFRKCYK